MNIDDAGSLDKGDHPEDDDEGEGDEEGLVDGAPEDLPDYLEDIWEYLLCASAADDWERALSLYGRFEKALGYPKGRVSSICIVGE